MSDFSVHVVNNITKEYNDMIKVIIYKEPAYFIKKESGYMKRIQHDPSEDYAPSISSVRRTKELVQDIVLCNDFEWFATFTFNPKKVNRYNFYACSSAMRRWFSHQRERSLERGIVLKYLVIPEQHKDGAWHFHALISGYTGQLHKTGNYTQNGRSVYNITSFRSGFTTAVPIDSKEGVSSYITKYITKAFVKTFNKRRFYCSKNLQRPVKTLNSNVLDQFLPIFRRKTIETRNQFTILVDKNSPASSSGGDEVPLPTY